MRSIFIISLLFACFTVAAQKIKYSDDMLEKLAATEIDLFEPLEGKYKSRYSLKNDYQKIDHTIYSKKEKLEIRYTIIPYSENNPATQIPHVAFMNVISSIAPNEEDVTVTVHTIPEVELHNQFNADWGSVAYFQPKPKFSKAKHCRLLTLYGDKRGTIHIFYLFDEPDTALDNRFYGMRFKTGL